MQQLFYFLQKYKYFLYFILLQMIALALTFNNLNFHKSKFISSTNFLSGSIIHRTASLSDYLNLKDDNTKLIKENTALKNEILKIKSLLNNQAQTQFEHIDTTGYHQKFKYISGKIRKNSFKKLYNFITVNIGEKDGIEKEMGVFNDKGIIGITDNVSNNFARVQSVLNKNTKINARFKQNYYFGSLTWNGKDHTIVQLTDLPRQAIFSVGDTVITGGKSTIFPEGIHIGTVLNIPEKLTASNTINIKLFNDMSNLSYVYIINSFDKKEFKTLENTKDE